MPRKAKRIQTSNAEANLETKRKRTQKRILLREGGTLPENALKGRVVATFGRAFEVAPVADDGSLDFDNTVECVAAGSVRSKNKKATIVAVGDFVSYLPDESDQATESGTIVFVEQRESMLSRKPVIGVEEDVIATNIEYLLIFSAAAEPFYNRRLIDRYLVSAEFGNLKPVIIINKIDLDDVEFIKEDFSIYAKMGIDLFYVSMKRKKGLKELLGFIKGKQSVLSGPSGAGKSTFINKVFGEELTATQEVSDRTGKGCHTTSSVCMYELRGGGLLIDTPGIREFGIQGMPKSELALYYHDFDEYRDKCRFMPCTHTHEPHCAVKEACENGKIDAERYESYINLYESLSEATF